MRVLYSYIVAWLLPSIRTSVRTSVRQKHHDVVRVWRRCGALAWEVRVSLMAGQGIIPVLGFEDGRGRDFWTRLPRPGLSWSVRRILL